MGTIHTSAFNTIPTITYKNDGRGGVIEVWVCENSEAFFAAKAELEAMSHIEIIATGDSHVKWKN